MRMLATWASIDLYCCFMSGARVAHKWTAANASRMSNGNSDSTSRLIVSQQFGSWLLSLREHKLLTRPSMYCGGSCTRCGFSATMGTDCIFGMARPRSNMAGWMLPVRRCGGRSCRGPSIENGINYNTRNMLSCGIKPCTRNIVVAHTDPTMYYVANGEEAAGRIPRR